MKIKILPNQPHCFAFGGFDMQMINALNAVRESGVDASRLDIWSREDNFDIIHVWGIGPHNYQILDWAKKSGKKIVATVLLPYFDTIHLKLSYCKHYFSKSQKILRYNYSLLDKVVVVNDVQSEVLQKFYTVPMSKIEIIPNIIEDNYFDIPTFNFNKKYEINDYILCTGNISSRKNQYNLAKACINLKLNLVLIGNVLDGEKAYAQKLEELISNVLNVRWIKELPKGSDELASAYYHCRLFALPSKNETQPISALEAVAMGKQLILNKRAYAKQKYYNGAVLTNTTKVSDIEVALQKAIVLKNKNVNVFLDECRAQNVGLKYKYVYEQLML